MKKHYHKGKAYWQVSPVFTGRCLGCAFDQLDGDCPDPNLSDHACYDSEYDKDGNEVPLKDVIWIPAIKKGMAEYVAKKLGADDEVPLD